MKAIKAVNKTPTLVDVPEPTGEGIKVKVVSASICGSDLHLLRADRFGDNIIGHEFGGIAEDGRAVAIEPVPGCGNCLQCDNGQRVHCEAGFYIMGIMGDGGMAEYVTAPTNTLVELPTGLDVATACLVEPLAVAIHGLNRARLNEKDRILIVGAGPIGLATGAVLQARGLNYDIVARYDHQRAAAESLGGSVQENSGYNLVIDAVGTTESMQQSIQAAAPLARIGLVGAGWDGINLDMSFSNKEVELLPATAYGFKSPNRSFEEAGRILHAQPKVAEVMVTHRFPLDGAEEAFATAADRASGAIKVAFDIAPG